MSEDAAKAARAVVDSASYMTLATADASGRPWASPVWFATADRHEFLWVSKPGARHSRNLAKRPEVSIVAFDSRAPLGTGGGVYLSGIAEEVGDDEVERYIGIFSADSQAQGGRAWTSVDVRPPARLRLYRAVVAEAWFGNRDDERIPVRIER